MNLSATIKRFAQVRRLVVTRRGNVAYSGGLPDGSSATRVELKDVLLLPLEGKAAQLLPEGIRTRHAVQVFTDELLRTAQADGHEADRFEHDDCTFEVHRVDDWRATAGYLRAIAVEVSP